MGGPANAGPGPGAGGCARGPRGADPGATHAPASLGGSAADAAATAAPPSRRPKPVSSFHVPAPLAVRSRTAATCDAVSVGFAAQTSAAAPVTCGAANEVPLAKP